MPIVLPTGGGNPNQVTATAATTHQMLVAIGILLLGGMLLVLIAGESDSAADAVLGFLAILLVVQGITKVNPFIEWVNKHPLIPSAS